MDATAAAADFRARLDSDGYTEVLERDAPPHSVVADHSHPFDARLLVLAGSLRLTHRGEQRLLSPGDWCEVPRGEVHVEAYAGDGCRLLVGRRY
jgi:quercetin dioxygenase-like cupin family protein